MTDILSMRQRADPLRGKALFYARRQKKTAKTCRPDGIPTEKQGEQDKKDVKTFQGEIPLPLNPSAISQYMTLLRGAARIAHAGATHSPHSRPRDWQRAFIPPSDNAPQNGPHAPPAPFSLTGPYPAVLPVKGKRPPES